MSFLNPTVLKDGHFPGGKTNFSRDYIAQVAEYQKQQLNQFVKTLYSHKIWGSDSVSIQNFSLPEKYFDRISGAIYIDKINHSSLVKFFNSERRVFFKGKFKLRGSDYYAPVNSSLSLEEKVDIILQNIADAAEAIEKYEHNTVLENDYFLFLAIQDYVKQALGILFHSFTYQERFGDLKIDNIEYQTHKQLLLKYFERSVEDMYSLIFGLHDLQKSKKLVLELRQRLDRLYSNTLLDVSESSLKLPENSHPVSLGISALRIADNHPNIDIVVGLPTGGTELSVLVKYILKVLTQKDIGLELLPVSTHSSKKEVDSNSQEINYYSLTRLIRNDLNGKNVLVVDDNSNTGSTLDIVNNLLSTSYALSSLNFAVSEIDTRRMVYKHVKNHNSFKFNFIPNGSIFNNIGGVVPITSDNAIHKGDRQMRKLRARQILINSLISNSEVLPSVDIELVKERKKIEKVVKICGVHNLEDLKFVIEGGANCIGIHLTYEEQAKYLDKVRKESALAYLEAERHIEFNPFGKLPIPWAEFRSLKHMIAQIHQKAIEMEIALLIRPKTGSEVTDIINYLFPSDFKNKIYIQVQSAYDSAQIKSIKDSLKSLAQKVVLVQTVGMDDLDANKKIISINDDVCVDMILIDSSQCGGTGKTGDMEQLKQLLNLASKPYFIAGGLSPDNISTISNSLKDSSLEPYGYDLESKVEKEAKVVVKNFDGKLTLIKERKDPEKIRKFVDNLTSNEKQD
ncbi:MAG: hypothetical protein OHK0017_07270 [Patescibacteria group bacterium]